MNFVEPPLSPGCNPLGGRADEDCFTPFPSSFYTGADTASGEQVKFPSGVLPANSNGVPLDPTPLNGHDGFSPATPIIAYFPSLAVRIEASNLPSFAAPADSLSPGSTVQLLDYDTGERVPLMAELDHNAKDGERQGLIIYPQLRLHPHTRYVVAIRGLRTTDGQPVPPLSGFAGLRDGQLSARSPRAGLVPRFEEIFALLAKQDVARGDLQLAWDFTTASDDPVYGRMMRMRDRAWAYKSMMMVQPVQISAMNEAPDTHLYRQIIGSFAAPSYLTNDVNGRLGIDGSGEPVLRGFGMFPLVIHIPSCAEMAMGPLPVMIYGHSLFGSALDEMESSDQREIIDRLCMVQIGTDWIGLTAADEKYLISSVPTNFNNLAQLTDRLQQAHINFAYLSQLVADGVFDELPELQVKGQLVYDKSRIYYYGISNGGSQGVTALALNPHFSRGALNVPGGFFSRMMWRSADFAQLAESLAVGYPDPLDRQILVAASQVLWDYTDPATYATHIFRDPLPGSGGPKHILYQEGIGDAQVPNLATRAMVRTMGLPLLDHPVEAVFGIGQVMAPVDSAYVQFDGEIMPRPGDTDTPPDDNAVNQGIRRLEAAKAQLQKFLLEDGKVVDTCAGLSCTFPLPPPMP